MKILQVAFLLLFNYLDSLPKLYIYTGLIIEDILHYVLDTKVMSHHSCRRYLYQNVMIHIFVIAK